MRREFQLPERDVKFLDATGRPWETIGLPGRRHVLIHGHPVPSGYNAPDVIAALKIDPGYDDAQIDMVYFLPALVRIDGKPIKAITNEAIDGKTFQRWSRHRTPANPWRPGEDYIGSHMVLVEDWLEREFLLKP
jgi:hypothetical protein